MNQFITLHEGRVKKCIEFLFFFSRNMFVQSRTQAHFTADVIISSELSSRTKVVQVTDYRGENWMYCLTIFIVFVCPRDIHFLHTKFLFEVTTDWRRIHSKFLAKSGDIFGNASCKSQSRTKLKSKLIQSEKKTYKTRQVTN